MTPYVSAWLIPLVLYWDRGEHWCSYVVYPYGKRVRET